MEYEDLLVEKKENIATITLNVPEKLNALTGKMSRSIKLAADDIEQDDEIRVAIVTGAGRGFCSGADVSMMAGGGGGGQVSRFNRIQHMGYPHADAFPRLNKPVIAAVNGPCVGGGFSLALSCDVRIASETARFGAAQVARALIPDWGLTFYLPLLIGMSNALQLMFTAELIGAAEAERLGIVSQVVAPDELMNVALELANKMAQNPPFSLALTKKMVWRGLFDSLDRQMDLEGWAQNICFLTEDHRESVKAFLEKKPPPKFKGK
jgi:enoyl-CoA hydratase/carnithine racemase